MTNPGYNQQVLEGPRRGAQSPINGMLSVKPAKSLLASSSEDRAHDPEMSRGEQKQAVGRSRGGRNTKIHALAGAKQFRDSEHGRSSRDDDHCLRHKAALGQHAGSLCLLMLSPKVNTLTEQTRRL